jgi:ubiquitin-protein ligase
LLRRVIWKKFIDLSEVLVAMIALMLEAASTSETSVKFYQITRPNNPEGSHLNTVRCTSEEYNRNFA